MMNIKHTILLTVAFLFMGFSSFAQQAKGQTGLEQTLHESGKINVVVVILCVVFIGIVFFLIKTDLKLKKLEKSIEDKQE